jgi:hypothetical protein
MLFMLFGIEVVVIKKMLVFLPEHDAHFTTETNHEIPQARGHKLWHLQPIQAETL